MAAGGAAAAQRDNDNSQQLYSIRDALNALRQEQAVLTPTVNELRLRQRNFFRINQRFPQCIDVGIRVWERMQDWHIVHQRPLAIQRTADGQWQMDFIMSVIVLKHELPDEEIGIGYDR